jgi:predicted cobalt transporter CbtA
MEEKELPNIALAINQLTSPQALRWLVVVALLGITGGLLIMGREVPAEVLGLFVFVLGSLFDVPQVSIPIGPKPKNGAE